jgi:hypothetical protein
VTASWLVVACAGRGGTGPVGVSDKVPGARAAQDAGDAGAIDGAAALPPNYRSTFVKVNKARFVSLGHASGRWDVDVWANELAQKALASHAREVPPGAIVVKEHYERSEGAAAADKPTGPIMVMEKKPPGFSREHGDWRWAIVGSQGQLVRDGVIEQCAGCHDDAPMDGLFPIVE